MPAPAKNESKQDYLKRCTSELISKEGRSSDQAYAMCNAYWDEAKTKAAKPIILTADLHLELAGKERPDEDRGFMMTAYTGQILDLGWFGRYVFSIEGMKAKAKIPILREHQRERVVGYSKKAWSENGNFLISGIFSKSTQDAKEVLALAQEGYPWQASVGISPSKIKTLDSDKESMVVNGQEVTGPIEIWLESKIGEVSFVSLGADDDTAAIALREQQSKIPAIISEPEKEFELMNLEELKSKYPDIYQEIFNLGAASVDAGKIASEARQEGITRERSRVTEILTAGADPEATNKAIMEGITVEASYKLFFETEKARKIAGLREMAESAPQSPGYKGPKEPDGIKDTDLELTISSKAVALVQSEKIDLAEATRRVLAENKELAARYYKQFDA